jgi:hypothetical protein
LVVSDDIESCRADQDTWFTSARGEPATLVEKPRVGPARGTGVKGRPLVPQATNNQRRSYADRLHNIRQLNRSSQSVLAARERLEIDWLISALAHHRHPAGRADGFGRL